MKFVALIVAMFGVVACSSTSPSSGASVNSIPRRCTSNVHCHSDEVCFSYDIYTPSSTHPMGPGYRWRDGFCGKLSE